MKVFRHRARLAALLTALPLVATAVAMGWPGDPAGAAANQCAICLTVPQTLYEIDGDGDNPRYVEVDIPLRSSQASLSRIDVTYRTVGDTATAPADFVAVQDGQVSILPRELVGHARVLVNKLSICQPGKHFDVVFSGPSQGRLDNAVTRIQLHNSRCPS